MKNAKQGWIGVTVAATMLCSLPALGQVQVVSATGGRVAGVLSHGVVSFKGIPFAAPPVGALRWKAPQPVVPWHGVRQADRYGPSCMQDSTFVHRFDAPPGISEDCLYLNVWTPAQSPRARLPVMVWIFGGGFVGGTTSIPAYDGTHFARKGVVLVSVAYRLGVFGFLADHRLTEESGEPSGNYGLEDMIAGLKWVKANIARFGGDPSRVTIFGESAGGLAVSMLAASPLARGLFERVISESGSSLAPAKYDGEGGEQISSLAAAEADGRRFLDGLGAKTLAEARALPAIELQKALGPGLQSRFWPVFDGRILRGDEYELYEARRFNDTPILVGTNSNEGSLFVRGGVTPRTFEQQVRSQYGTHAGAILAVYPHGTNAAAFQSARDLARDSTFAWGTWSWARLQTDRGKGRAYLYYFDHRTPQQPHGAGHGSEIGFVFGNLGGPRGGPAGLRGPPSRADIALSDLIGSYWVNFARTGNPNGPGVPEWPAFHAPHAEAMVFGHDPPGPHPVPNLAKLEALNGYYAYRRAEARERAKRAP